MPVRPTGGQTTALQAAQSAYVLVVSAPPVRCLRSMLECRQHTRSRRAAVSVNRYGENGWKVQVKERHGYKVPVSTEIVGSDPDETGQVEKSAAACL